MRFGACQSSQQLGETGRQTPLAAASCAIKGLDWRGMRSFFMLPIYFWQNPLWHTVFHAFLFDLLSVSIFYLICGFQTNQ
jgi:hypothetical protein